MLTINSSTGPGITEPIMVYNAAPNKGANIHLGISVYFFIARVKDKIAPAAATNVSSNFMGMKSGKNPYNKQIIKGNMIVNQDGVWTHIDNIKPSKKNNPNVISPEITPTFQPPTSQPTIRLIIGKINDKIKNIPERRLIF